MELKNVVERFEALDTTVVAIAQEDEDLESHARMLERLGPVPGFEVLADLGRAKTTEYDRTTAYLIDREGVVRQIFPMIIHARPSWQVVLDEATRILHGGAGPPDRSGQ